MQLLRTLRRGQRTETLGLMGCGWIVLWTRTPHPWGVSLTRDGFFTVLLDRIEFTIKVKP